MLAIFERDKKHEREMILRKAISDTIVPFKVVTILLSITGFILGIINLIIGDQTSRLIICFDVLYFCLFFFSLLAIVLLNAFIKDKEHGYKYIRYVEMVYFFITLMLGVLFSILETVFTGNSNYIIYCTLVIIAPVYVYINRYLLLGYTFFTQVLLFIAMMILKKGNVLNDAADFFLFCVACDISSVILGFVKRKSIRREIMVDKLSNRDPLTELLNRQKLNNDSEKIFETNVSNKYELSSIMIDIDNFKSINDNYGHLVGDVVIKTIAKILKEESKEIGCMCYRYGGEEFLILGSDVSRNQAINLVEKIQNRLKDTNIEGVEEKVTLSFGIFTKVPTNEDDIESFYDKADKLLYESKQNGKNRYTYNMR